MLGDHPLMIRAFAALADKMGEDNIVQASGPAYLTPAQLDKQIREYFSLVLGLLYSDLQSPFLTNQELLLIYQSYFQF